MGPLAVLYAPALGLADGAVRMGIQVSWKGRAMTTAKRPYVEFSQALFDDICARIGEGASLRSICQLKTMPHKATVLGWIADNEKLQVQYALALEARAEYHFEEILDIADKVRIGTKKVSKADGGIEITKADMIERARLMVDARKWVLARMNPKKYGDKFTQELTGDPQAPVQLVLKGSDVNG
jgi:hypothetical protein